MYAMTVTRVVITMALLALLLACATADTGLKGYAAPVSTPQPLRAKMMPVTP
jgi:hypothetical protein